MALSGRVKIVVPGDEPTQIGGSSHLEKLTPFGDVVLYSRAWRRPLLRWYMARRGL